MEQYTDFTLPNQPTNSHHRIRPCWRMYSEDYTSPHFIDTLLRILLNRMVQGAAPPAETWNKIIERACSLNLRGSD
jgi:hypothetical protein